MSFHVRHVLTGVPLYAVGSLVGQVSYGLAVYNEGIIAAATFATLFFFAFLAGRDLEAKSIGEVLRYSFFWVLIAIGLDSVIVVPIVGWQYLSALDVLISYGILAFAPLFSLYLDGAAQG